MSTPTDADWVNRFADEVIAAHASRYPNEPDRQIVVASGISPSGPIHLGNLRELMTPHLVADEIRRRGLPCRHLLSWDDFDRFRKVPFGIPGVDDSWNTHIGRPLTSIPAPPGSPYASWAEHFKAPLLQAMTMLGIEVDQLSQTEKYTAGDYRDQVLLAMRERRRIDAVLGRYRTKKAPAKQGKPLDAADEAAARAAAEGSGAAAEDDGTAGTEYYPYKPYCTACDRDLTTVTGYDDETTELTYTCSACGHSETVKLSQFNHGKLVWKVDWPMRWAFEGVEFEPSGVDHSSPGSSFVVGTQLVQEIFDAPAPIGPMYAFVGISGQAKMSSSRGGVPIALDALAVMEPQLLRWQYARRRPNQAIKVSFDGEIQRLYDEWDSLCRKVSDGSANEADSSTHSRAVGTVAAGPLPTTPRPLPYRMLASIADVTAGDDAQVLRILQHVDAPAAASEPTAPQPVSSLDDVRPRLDKAAFWVANYVPESDRTVVRSTPDGARLAALEPHQRAELDLLLAGLETHWSLDALTTLLYGVPKQRLGLAPDVKPTPELKAAQRSFFALLYELLLGKDTGPRLPTLLLAIGQDRVRDLLP